MSTRTSRADKNWFSISANTYQYYAGTDSPKSVDLLPKAPFFEPDQPESWDAIFKYSDGSYGHTFSGMRVSQGRENAIDCNNGSHDAYFHGQFGCGGGLGDQVLTVKGGCRNLTFAGYIGSEGRNAHIVVGAYSDQCHDISIDLDFSQLTHIDGRRLTFVLARCKRVKLPKGAKVLRLKSLSYSLYWYLKYAAVKLGLL